MKNLLETFILDIINKYDTFFLFKKNVIGIGLGNKFINGKESSEPCLNILVSKKVSLKNLYKYEIIPTLFLGIKTDVIEVGTFNSTSMPSTKKNIPNKYQLWARPIKPGYGIGLYNVKSYGTLGAIVYGNEKNKENTPYILSNNHVIANNNRARIGDPILQPSLNRWGVFETDVVANLSKFIFKNFGESSKDNYSDCAIAEIEKDIEIDTSFDAFGNISGIVEPKIGMMVSKTGATSGHTIGTIKRINSTLEYEEKYGKITYKNLIFTNRMAASGDSGSLLTNLDGDAVGLLIGGNGTESFFSPIQYVLDKLNVHFKN